MGTISIDDFTFQGDSFLGQATDNVKLLIRRVVRPLRQARRRHKVVIPGRAGTWDFGVGPPEDYTITVEITISGEEYGDAMNTVEALKGFLDGKGALIFGDQPDEVHTAEVYDQIDLDPQSIGATVYASIEFECDAKEEEGS